MQSETSMQCEQKCSKCGQAGQLL